MSVSAASTTQYSDTESDDDDITELTQPIILIRERIIEPVSVFNYIQVIVNVLWLVDEVLGNDCAGEYKINLAVLVLESYQELRQFRSAHWGCCESILKLAENGKLNHLRKKISIGQ